MLNRQLTKITVSTELFHVEPLQQYIGYLAEQNNMPKDKRLHLSIVFEEIFSHIVKDAFKGKNNGEIHISVLISSRFLTVRFHYWGLPFGYNMESAQSVDDYISNLLIRKLCSSYSMTQNGKEGQTVELRIALPSSAHDNPNLHQTRKDNEAETVLTDAPVKFREIKKSDLKSLVQCLYQVFGYTYSGDALYCPELIGERMDNGVYKGFAAVDTDNKVVAHVAMLKESRDARICESGQAFVMPEYNKRGLFSTLKKHLAEYAKEEGLFGVMSSAVAGHPYTQRANVKMGCIETGLKLAYIPSNLQSMIGRDEADQRQSVMEFFLPLKNEAYDVYLPERHADIMSKTYALLGFERNLKKSHRTTDDWDDISQLSITVKTEWNQLVLDIEQAGKDLASNITKATRQAMASGTAVIYARLPLTSPDVPAVCAILEKEGFFYAGIIPHEKEGIDTLHMQYLADTSLTPESVVAYSDWANELKNYIFACKASACE